MRKLLVLLFVVSNIALYGQTENQQQSGSFKVVEDLYTFVSVKKGEAHNWDKVRNLFIPEANILLRTTRTSSTLFDLDGFIADFVKFVSDYKIINTGFTERIVSKEIFEYGDIAHILVLYEVNIPVEGFKPQLGIDSIQLIRKDGEWKIFSIVNEVPAPGQEIPDRLNDQKPKV